MISSSIESSLGLRNWRGLPPLNAGHHSRAGHAGFDAGAAGTSLAG
ncbi:hypothetical protein ACLK1T_22495 [Escherichia coli]